MRMVPVTRSMYIAMVNTGYPIKENLLPTNIRGIIFIQYYLLYLILYLFFVIIKAPEKCEQSQDMFDGKYTYYINK